MRGFADSLAEPIDGAVSLWVARLFLEEKECHGSLRACFAIARAEPRRVDVNGANDVGGWGTDWRIGP